MISEAYILFLAFQDKLLSEGHYYVFLKEEQRRPSKCFTLSWGGGTGNSLFQGFPRAFLGLEQAGSPQPIPCQFCVLFAQLCLTLCDSMDCSQPGSSIHGVLEARILEWVVIPFSRGSSQPRDQTWVSCSAGRFFTIWATREVTQNQFRIHSILKVLFL